MPQSATTMKQHEFQFAAKQFRAGKLSIKDFTDLVFDRSETDKSKRVSLQEQLADLCSRQPDSHKGDYGRVLVVGGSPGMSGAAGLTGLAALRTGSGLVTVATDQRCQSDVAAIHPALMTAGLPFGTDDKRAATDDTLAKIAEHRFDCLAIGPGLGSSASVTAVVKSLLSGLLSGPNAASVPVVVDADGINALANALTEDFSFPDQPAAPLVLTPHPGELARLSKSLGSELAADSPREALEQFAMEIARPGRIVVLKGHRTLITDGTQHAYNTTGNAGMATAGSGDVLTGIIASLIGQGLDVWKASTLGCFIHGRAGDLAAKRKSQVAMLATDIVDALPGVFGS